jgi:hypothetical protein
MMKYFSKGLVSGEYPKRTLAPVVKEFSERVYLENSSKLNCFVSWKSNKLTKTHAEEYRDFVSMNEDVQFWLFSDESERSWMSRHFHKHQIFEVYKGAKFGAMKSDIFRLCLLLKYGGVFTGINRVFDVKLTEIFANRNKFLISFEPNIYSRQSVSNLIPSEFKEFNVVQHSIFSPPEHKVIEIAIETIVEHAPHYNRVVFDSVKDAIWNFSAPYFLTRVIDKYLTEFGGQETEFHGLQFNNSCRIPKGAQYRYAASPSYLGSRNCMILDMDEVGNAKDQMNNLQYET